MKKWSEYKALAEERPMLFTKEGLEVIFDETEIEEFEKESGREIGILYESPWRYLVVDLVKNSAGKLFAYERIIPTKTGGVAILPVYNGGIVLIHEYRHPVNEWKWEIPRGFGTAGFSAKQNAEKELWEETGLEAENMHYLGQINPDSGLTSDHVDLFLAEIKEMSLSLDNKEGTEEIEKVRLFSIAEVKEMIATGKITDSFTLSALGIWWLTKKD